MRKRKDVFEVFPNCYLQVYYDTYRWWHGMVCWKTKRILDYLICKRRSLETIAILLAADSDVLGSESLLEAKPNYKEIDRLCKYVLKHWDMSDKLHP